jgi:cell division protein FtsW (lipid II flippase)
MILAVTGCSLMDRSTRSRSHSVHRVVIPYASDMTATLTAGRRGEPAPAGRSAAALLIAGWVVAVVASYVGEPDHGLTLKLVTAFLLWRVWRGATWSRYFLIGLSVVSAGLAAGLSLAIMLGATGIVTRSLAMFGLYAVVGALLCAPPIRRLCR